MNKLLILALLIPSLAEADINNISWTAPTQWTDNTPIEKLEYHSLYCESLAEPIKIIDGEAYKVEELAIGEHDCYLTASAKWKGGMQESAPSNILKVEIYPNPKSMVIRFSGEITVEYK